MYGKQPKRKKSTESLKRKQLAAKGAKLRSYKKGGKVKGDLMGYDLQHK